MTPLRRFVPLALLALLALPAANAQFLSELVGFNDNPDVETSREMFLIPQASGSTDDYIVLNSAGLFDNNNCFRASGLQTEGPAAMYTFWSWINPNDPDAWLRFTTFNAAVRPNPALHLSGKVRFKLNNQSEFFRGTLGVCIGVRETGENVPQLYNGGSNGAIEWVGVRETPSVITAGPNNTLDSTPSGDDVVQALTGGLSAIVAGPNGVLDSTAAGDDVVGSGFTYGVNGERRPLPVIELSPNLYELEFNLVTGDVKVDGVTIAAGFAGFTGDGVLSAANNRGVLEHIAFTNVINGNQATNIVFAIDEMQFEAPVADPTLPPVVNAPIINGDLQVTVSGIQANVNQVNLLRNHIVILTQNVSTQDPVVFTLPQAAQTGEVYTATQRSSITGVLSDESAPVTVLAAPARYGFSFVLDEDGDIGQGCTFNGTLGGWEVVGASAFTSGTFIHPVGGPVFQDSAQWQTIEIPLDDPNIVFAWLGGNGQVDVSPTGRYALDTIWFDMLGNNPGPHEVLVDQLELVDGNDNLVAAIYNFEDGVTVLNAVRGQSDTPLTTAALWPQASYQGRVAHRMTWTYPSGSPRAIGILARQSTSCATRATFNAPAVLEGARFRMRIVARAPRVNPSVPLPVILLPPRGTDTSVAVGNDAAATAVQLYINGVAFGSPVAPTGTQTTINGVSLSVGDSVSAKQVVGGVESDFAYPRAAVASLLPGAPVIAAPVQAGDLSVNLTGVSLPDTTLVEILDPSSNVIGSTTNINPNGTATVPLSRGLIHLERITARATNVEGSSLSTNHLEVGIGNGDVYLCIGVRENNDPGPLGSPATVGTAATIEWIGATGTVSGAPIGRPLSPSPNWITLTFDPATDPILASNLTTGSNGILDVPRGTLEHLALTINDTSANRSAGLYRIYVDNVINVGANGGSDFLLTDFESFAVGTEVLFQEPTFSGSTAANMTPTPSSSAVTADEGNPGQSLLLQCYFRDTAPGRWARITTSSTVNPLRNPIIDLTRPIRFDLLLISVSVTPGDCNCDGAVNNFDIDAFVLALSNPDAYAITYPDCDLNSADVNGDGLVNNFDIDPFVQCIINGGCP